MAGSEHSGMSIPETRVRETLAEKGGIGQLCIKAKKKINLVRTAKMETTKTQPQCATNSGGMDLVIGKPGFTSETTRAQR